MSAATMLLRLPFALAALLAAAPAAATLCSVDDAPAATLLVPYFEVDLADPLGHTTLVAVFNHSVQPRIVQVTLWTDAGQPVLSYPLYLHGRHTRAMNLQDALVRGFVPRDQHPTLQPPGNMSGPHAIPPTCTLAVAGTSLPPDDVTAARLALSGQPNARGECGHDHGDGLARGYLTVDVRTACTTALPDEAAYHSFGLGHDNVLSGEYFYVDPLTGPAQGETAVAIEADTAGTLLQAGHRSFYGAWSGSAAVDRREPLPSRWSASLAQGVAPARSDEFIVWRQAPSRANACTTPAGPLGLGNALPVQFFDAAGAATAWTPGSGENAVLGFATQRRAVAGSFGAAGSAAARSAEFRLQDDARASGQAWVGVLSREGEGFGTLHAGAPLDGNCPAGASVTLPAGGPLAINPQPGNASLQFFFISGFED